MVLLAQFSHSHGKKLGFLFKFGVWILSKITKENIITAMKLSGTKVLPEGVIYKLLFDDGLTADQATLFMKSLLDDGTINRVGCALTLREPLLNGKEDTSRQGAVRNN